MSPPFFNGAMAANFKHLEMPFTCSAWSCYKYIRIFKDELVARSIGLLRKLQLCQFPLGKESINNTIKGTTHMEISGNSGGAAVYAMQQATKMPGAVVDLLQKSAEGGQGKGSLRPPSPELKEPDLTQMTGKGSNINIVA